MIHTQDQLKVPDIVLVWFMPPLHHRYQLLFPPSSQGKGAGPAAWPVSALLTVLWISPPTVRAAPLSEAHVLFPPKHFLIGEKKKLQRSRNNF